MELIKDYEVYGNWNTEKAAGQCPKCAAKLQLVPEEGHFNSQYWKLKQNDGLELYCCPTGCDANFKEVIEKASKPIDEKILKYFYMMHDVDVDNEDDRFDIGSMINNHTTSVFEHQRKVHYIFLKDFIYNYNGFRSFHDDQYDNRANTEFMIDKKSGLVFFNIYSHEPFAGNLYRPLYRNLRGDDRLGQATEDGLCVWQSTTSDTIFGLEECQDKSIQSKFK